MAERYPGYDVLSKWSGPSFDTVTRGVLRQRLHRPPERRFFNEDEWALMEALCARLAPTPERGETIAVTPWIDADLHAARGEGYRPPHMPPLQEAWRRGLAAIAAEAQARHGRPFLALGAAEQEAECRRLVAGEGDAAVWGDLKPKAFFRDMLLKAVASVHYAHPAAWSEVGFGGPASPRGYVRLGLDERDPWEAREAGA